jgi:hypothetical protein
MPIELENSEFTTWVRYVGFVPPREFIEAMDRIAHDPFHDKRRNLMIDLTGMDSDSIWALTPDMTNYLGAHNHTLDVERRNLRKMAFVSDSQKLLDLSKLYADKYTLSPNAEVRLFRSLPPAWAWFREDS